MLYVLYAILSFILAILTFIAGFFVGYKLSNPKKKTKYSVKENEISDSEKRKAERTKKEIANMLSYTGDAQDEIVVD